MSGFLPVDVRVRLGDGAVVPTRGSEGAAGYDVRSTEDGAVTLEPLERHSFSTGLHPQLPSGYELQVRGRSGLAIRDGIVVIQGVGTVDSDYRGEILVCLINLDRKPHTILPGDRIAQLVLAEVTPARFTEANTLEATARGEQGFGSTGR